MRSCHRADRYMSISPRYRYEVALLYLKQADYNLEEAIGAYKEDERWEQEHPLKASRSEKNDVTSPRRRRWGLGGGITGQLS